MSISDDTPPSDDFPPPARLTKTVKAIVSKLNSKNELIEYLDHISAYNSYHLSDLTQELQERLLLQGLDEDDIYALHEFLAINFDNGLLYTTNRKTTEKRADILKKYT